MSLLNMHMHVLAKTYPPHDSGWLIGLLSEIQNVQSTTGISYYQFVSPRTGQRRRTEVHSPPHQRVSPACKGIYELPGSKVVHIHCYCIFFSSYTMLIMKSALVLFYHLYMFQWILRLSINVHSRWESLACSMMKVPRQTLKKSKL